MNSQFKFKPDKIKYLSNVDTLDSSHKKIVDTINKKREDKPNKIFKLNELKNGLENLDNMKHNFDDMTNFIKIRSKLIDDISNLEEELFQIENYEEETEYYSKTYQILFNYYDMLDGLIDNELNVDLNLGENINPNNDSHNILNNELDSHNISNNETDYLNLECNNINQNSTNDINVITKDELPNVDIWEFDGSNIFNSIKSSKLDLLNELSKTKRKEKKTTRKRVKNIESLIKNNNCNIFDFIHSGIKNDNNNNELNNSSNNNLDIYDTYDRAKLYEDYKTSLEGYTTKKKFSKPCANCGVDKILIYSEGMYACMKCGEVENCIIESEITNYKDPMIEKPTFPYKRKNHFCEWILLTLLVKVITKNNGYSLIY